VARAHRRFDRPGVKADAFVPVGDLDEAHYAQLRPGLAPVPGVVFAATPSAWRRR